MGFVPRLVFPTLLSLPRSYFLGHHRAGLEKMRTLLGSTDLILECRDSRVPITSRNPLFEQALAGKPRVIIHTKRDLVDIEQKEMHAIRHWHRQHGADVLFTHDKDPGLIKAVLRKARELASERYSLTGMRMMVVGMPNVGKSSLLNALRKHGIGRGKVASTGAQPGITRKIGTTVKVVPNLEEDKAASFLGVEGGIYLLDTPGVFIPYVPSPEAMLKLSLCGSVKDSILPPTIAFDYLLFHINLHDPSVYAQYGEPTNDPIKLLDLVARKTGRLQKGGERDLESTALWLIQRWRTGHLGRFLLDEVDVGSLQRKIDEDVAFGGSITQARKLAKTSRTA